MPCQGRLSGEILPLDCASISVTGRFHFGSKDSVWLICIGGVGSQGAVKHTAAVAPDVPLKKHAGGGGEV